MNKLVINYIGREKRYALLKDQTVEKLVIEQPNQQSSVGNIYLGVVTKVLPGMNAAFVDIGEEKSGYLHRDKLSSFVLSNEAKESKEAKGISSYIRQGEKLLVQVEKDVTGTKGPRLTGIIEFMGESVVYMPSGRYIAVSKKIEDEDRRSNWRKFGHDVKEEKEGLIFRTACETRIEEQLLLEINSLREQYKKVLGDSTVKKKPGLIMSNDSFFSQIQAEVSKLQSGEIVVDDMELKRKIEYILQNDNIQVVLHTGKENVFSANRLEHDLEKALKRIIWLDNGAYLIFEETEAFTIVDVNTGKFSGKNNLQDTVLRTNELAAEEIARQLRLRDIGGMILIDFIDMKEERDKVKIKNKLSKELQKDETRTRIADFTSLGILQLTRKKTKVSLSENLTTKCRVCDGTGKVLSAETVAFQLERQLWEHRNSDYEAVLIETSKEVMDVFAGEQHNHKNRLEDTLGLKFYFTIKGSNKPFFEIRKFGTVDELKTIE